MRRRFWRAMDRLLAQMGLMRVALVPRIEVMARTHGRRYIKIQFANGHTVSGYLDATRGIIKYGDNPAVPR